MSEKYIEVKANVIYWEDAKVNGVDDVNGTLIPLRIGDNWCPKIRLDDGIVMNWQIGIRATVYYKVCDRGEYWLLDENLNRVAKWSGSYVPDSYLCHGAKGYGDYIIMDIGIDGKIKDYQKPEIDYDFWDLL